MYHTINGNFCQDIWRFLHIFLKYDAKENAWKINHAGLICFGKCGTIKKNTETFDSAIGTVR
jgi:hypothetical protein